MRYQHFWPPNDTYFGTGVTGIIDEISLITNERNYLFVSLNRYSLLNALSFFSRNKDINKIIIIVSSSRLMPLAFFWFDNIKNVIAVFDTKIPVSEIINKISRCRNGDKVTTGRGESSFKISSKDIMKIKYFLTDSGMEELQDRFMNSPSTMYRWRKEIAVKFGVRDPRYLLLPESTAWRYISNSYN